MRNWRLLFGILVVTATTLGLLGCGGGGSGSGGSTPTPTANYGQVTVDMTAQLASYTPPAAVANNVVWVYAQFTSASQTTPVTVGYERPSTQNGTWKLDLSNSSTDFSTSMSGTYTMTSYVEISTQTTPVSLPATTSSSGSGATPSISVPLNVGTGSGTGGPPPPPVWTSAKHRK